MAAITTVLTLWVFLIVGSGCVQTTGGAALKVEGAGGQAGLGDDPSIVDVGQIDDINDISGDPLEKVNFRIEQGLYDLDNGVGVRWDGCDTNQFITGGYNNDKKCGKAFFHPDFAVHLEQNFYICVRTAATDAGYDPPAKVFLRHIGSYKDNGAGNGRFDLHSYARAIDIEKMKLIREDGEVTYIPTTKKGYKGAGAVFYDSFRRCWADSLPSTCVPGQNEYRGSVGHIESQLGGNSRNANHLQLSYPNCAD